MVTGHALSLRDFTSLVLDKLQRDYGITVSFADRTRDEAMAFIAGYDAASNIDAGIPDCTFQLANWWQGSR